MKDLTPEEKFDGLVRASLEGFEMPADPSAWARFEQQLPAQPVPGMTSLMKGVIGTLVIGGMAAAGYLMWPDTPDTQPLETSPDTTVQQEAIQEPAPSHAIEGTSAASPSGQRPITGNRPDEVQTVTGPSDRNSSPSAEKSEDTVPSEKTSDKSGAANPDDRSPEVAESTGTPSDVRKASAVTLAIKMTRNAVCVGEELQLAVVTNTGGMTYLWQFSDGHESTRPMVARSFDAAGNYSVTLTATRDGEVYERMADIEVRPTPEADFKMRRLEPGIPLYALSIALKEGEQCRWTFSDTRTGTDPDTRHLFRRRGDAGVELMVTNASGCTVVARRSERIDEDFRLFAADKFTPNGDGLNDHFLPRALEVMDCAFEMVIQDRANREVYRTSDPNAPWNGRENNSGAILPSGKYIWTVVLKEAILHEPVFTGEIFLQQ